VSAWIYIAALYVVIGLAWFEFGFKRMGTRGLSQRRAVFYWAVALVMIFGWLILIPYVLIVPPRSKK
jgi:hypothetical protein